MTPIAAYYVFVANQELLDAEAAHGTLARRRPSLLDRVRALVAALRPQSSLARSA